MNTCCCQNCCTLYAIDRDGELIWKVNYFFDVTYQLSERFSQTPGLVFGCDVDDAGNVYQVGMRTNPIVPSPTLEQTIPMYTLRSWDGTGAYRWSWSEAPYGYMSGGIRNPPNTLIGCRCSKLDDQNIVIVADQGANTPDRKVNATALDSDGNQLWRVKLEQGVFLHSAGTTRSLWARQYIVLGSSSLPSGGFVVLDNEDGSTKVNVPGGSTWSDPLISPSIPAYAHERKVMFAAMDKDDTVYTVESKQVYSMWVSTGSQGVPFFYGIARYPKDSAVADKIVESRNFYYGSQNNAGVCLKLLGQPTHIVLTETRIIVGSNLGVEIFDKETMESIEVYCFALDKILYSDDEQMGLKMFGISQLFPFSLHDADTNQFKIWDQDSDGHDANTASLQGPMMDARALTSEPINENDPDRKPFFPHGGSLWSQNYTCINHELIDDTRTIDRRRTKLCYDVCFECDFPLSYSDDTHYCDYVIEPPDAMQFTSFSAARLCAAYGCNWAGLYLYSLRVEPDLAGATLRINLSVNNRSTPGFVHVGIYNQGVYRCDDFDENGGEFYLVSTGAVGVPPVGKLPSFPDTVNMTPIPCNTVRDSSGQSDCTGFQDYIAKGGNWFPDGPATCADGCEVQSPVADPTSDGQRVSVKCA